MSTLTRLKAKFGHNTVVPVEAEKYQARTLTSAIQNTLDRLEESIEIISQVKDLRRTRKAECKSPMCHKYRGNLVFKLGYGKYNHTISEDLNEIYLTSPAEAVACMQDAKKMILEGALDQYMNSHLEVLRARTQAARDALEAAKENANSGEPVERKTSIFPIADKKAA